ncbi:MAG: D-alanyl-D-alanine carboxypeptidase family protein [Huintestinicola sp.]
MKKKKGFAARLISAAAAFLIMIAAFIPHVYAEDREYAESYVLMETTTSTVIRSRAPDKKVPMGSFPKLMTVLLAAEAMDRGELSFEMVLTVSEHANSMGGAKIWLMPGDKISLEELLKGVIIGNANDAACVIAEKIGGTEEKFTALMNERASELGMKNTLFVNSTGSTDDELAYTTAYDAALLLCELSHHEELAAIFTSRLEYIRDNEVQLVTTNRMGHRYKGSVGFKCGRGEASGYFAAEGAKRDGICFAAAVMDMSDEDRALALAAELLDIAFAGYTVTSPDIPEELQGTIIVKEGCSAEVRLSAEAAGNLVVPKGREGDIRTEISLPSYVYAPLDKGQWIGELRYYLGDKLLKSCRITSAENIEKKNFFNVLYEFMKFLVSF